jgi:hypothetical protein
MELAMFGVVNQRLGWGWLLLLATVWSCKGNSPSDAPTTLPTAGHAGHSGQAGSAGVAVAVGGQAGTGNNAGQAGSAQQAGQAGTAGSSTQVPAWLTDMSLWENIPGTEYLAPECDAYVPKNTANIPDPDASWTSCGIGCESRTPEAPFAEFGSRVAAKTVLVGNQAKPVFAWTSGMRNGEERWLWRRVGSVDDGSTWGLYSVHYDSLVNGFSLCSIGVVNESPMHASVGNSTNDSAMTLRFDHQGWNTYTTPSNKIIGIGASLDVNEYQAMYVSGNVLTRPSPTSDEWTMLDDQAQARPSAGAEGDMVIWPSGKTGTPWSIWGWRDDGLGTRELLGKLPWWTLYVGMSDTHMVGVAGEFQSAFPSPLVTAVLWHAPRSTQGQPGVPASIALPAPKAIIPSSVRTWGDYAAMLVREQIPGGGNFDYPYLVIAKLSTGKLWKWQRAKDKIPMDYALALTDTHLYYGERWGLAATEDFVIRAVVRLSLDKIAEIAEPLN